MSADEIVLRNIVEAIRREALGPDWRQTATAYPLKAAGGENERDHWTAATGIGLDAARRKRGPAITVWNNRDWLATAIVSPKGKNPVVLVDEDAQVFRVGRRGE